MGTVSTQNGRMPEDVVQRVGLPELEKKTQCYIATLLNREVNALRLGIDAMLNAGGKLDAKELTDAALNYRRARDERDAFAEWMEEQGAE